MPVEQRADGIQNRRGGGPEEVGVGRLPFLFTRDKGALAQVVLEVRNLALLGPPAGFELAEAFVFQLGPSEGEALEALPGEPFDRLPHDQVVRPQMLVGPVRGSVFVDGPVAEMKIYVPGYGLSLEIGQGDEAAFLGNNMFMHFLEKMERLGGKAMRAASHSVQAAEFAHCLFGILDPDFDLFLFRLFDIPAGAVAEAGVKGFLAPGQVEGMGDITS